MFSVQLAVISLSEVVIEFLFIENGIARLLNSLDRNFNQPLEILPLKVEYPVNIFKLTAKS